MARQTSVQITEATDRQVKLLSQNGYGTFTDIVRIAIDRMFQQEVSDMKHRQSDESLWEGFCSYTTEPEEIAGIAALEGEALKQFAADIADLRGRNPEPVYDIGGDEMSNMDIAEALRDYAQKLLDERQ